MGSKAGGFWGDGLTEGGPEGVVLGEGLMRSFSVGATWGVEDTGGT